MVLSTEIRETNRNGKRSRGSSPSASSINNTNSKALASNPGEENLTPDTSDDDCFSKKNLGKPKNGKSEFEEKIRVGKDYQVIVQERGKIPDVYPDKALLVWSPAQEIPDGKLDEYITLARERYGYNSEQALGMLFWHKHDLEKAVIDLANFTPFPDEWTKEDKVLFEQAFQFHGKCFHRIRQMLPDKSIASLVKFYYSWKKTRSRASAAERQEKKKNEGGSENGSENGSPEDSDVEEKVDSDDDAAQVKDAEMIGNIDEIIGVNSSIKKDNDEVTKTPGKTSIMTTSTGKTLKRKHDDDLVKINDDICIITEDKIPEKKFAAETKSEITITPIPKVSDDKTNGKVTEATVGTVA
ncbi:CLUMA_CG017849, isoform A [Clunio marinus]|uniref:CLUMA_CG017849, isoform A n=1 Tax=Clunio marinus TaxID=568069 RepID=A0A1J1J1Q6_9DIPT|nr:CLUMA_CG017849, isoform A [Clunio marinus]